MADHYLAVDVGTASARAALVTAGGVMVETAVESIDVYNPQPGFYEQSSDNIWTAVVAAIVSVMKKSRVSASEVKAVGFDATCSLVALDDKFQPVSCSQTGDSKKNIIMWMDHRAEMEASKINATGHSVLRFVGGTMSLEMQPPKLLWLKKNLPQQWEKMAHLFDLPDFLTWRATGSLSRSLCSLVCKWGYEVNESQMGWNNDFLEVIGLPELASGNYSRIGNQVSYPGQACASGLSSMAAEELGLLRGTAVGTSLIDAHAGAVACLGCVPTELKLSMPPITSRLALICGTSTCHMMVSKAPVFVPGVWGPYFSAMVPGFWTCEGGQSATGKLIDFIVEGHHAFVSAKNHAEERGMHLYQYLNTLLEDFAEKLGIPTCQLTSETHVYPDFHGNRSPLADPRMKGMICGLTLSATEQDLAFLYLATVQALAYGSKHILQELGSSGCDVQVVYLCGGLRKNPIFVQTHADAIGLPVILPETEESVLLGAAMLAACASGNFENLQAAMISMGRGGQVVYPNAENKLYHAKKYAIYTKMLSDQRSYFNIMFQEKERNCPIMKAVH